MTIANKYIQQCKSLFPVYGKLERTFLNRLKVQVNEHLDLFPDISYNELVKQFGSPREVVMEFPYKSALSFLGLLDESCFCCLYSPCIQLSFSRYEIYYYKLQVYLHPQDIQIS